MCMCVCMYVCMYVCMHICVYIYIYIYLAADAAERTRGGRSKATANVVTCI